MIINLFGFEEYNATKCALAKFVQNNLTVMIWVDAQKGTVLKTINQGIDETGIKYEIIEEYKASGIGILDETGELKRLVESCDMFYGDSGFLSDYFGQTGKPVFIQDYHVKMPDLTGYTLY